MHGSWRPSSRQLDRLSWRHGRIDQDGSRPIPEPEHARRPAGAEGADPRARPCSAASLARPDDSGKGSKARVATPHPGHHGGAALPATRQLVLHIRWQGDTSTDTVVSLPKPAAEAMRYPDAIVVHVRAL